MSIEFPLVAPILLTKAELQTSLNTGSSEGKRHPAERKNEFTASPIFGTASFRRSFSQKPEHSRRHNVWCGLRSCGLMTW